MKIIAVNYNFNPFWLKNYDYLLYDRSDNNILKHWPQGRIIRTENIGNADYDRLTYLIDNYDNLPKVFILCKSNLFKYITEDEFKKVKENQFFTPLLTQNHKVYEPICRYAEGIYEEINNSWYASQFKRKFNTYGDWANFMGLDNPEYLRFAPGGNYILTSDRVKRYPKEFYIKMRKTLEHAVLPAEAQYVERSYFILWQ